MIINNKNFLLEYLKKDKRHKMLCMINIYIYTKIQNKLLQTLNKNNAVHRYDLLTFQLTKCGHRYIL